MKVFKYDTVKLILNTGKTLTTFTQLKIKYEKPDGTDGRWTAAICPTNALCLQATVQFTAKGVWRVQAYIFKAGEWYHGQWADVRVFDALATTTTVPPTTVAPTTLAPTTGP